MAEYLPEPILGMRLGLIVRGEEVAGVDYLSIRQYLPPINLPPNYPKNVVRERLGPEINTPENEVHPVITADGRVMYFVRGEYNACTCDQDIRHSERLPDGRWAPARSIGSPLNNNASNSVISVTPDGNQLLVRGTYNLDGTPAGPGISHTRRAAKGWEVPSKVPIQNFYNDDLYAEHTLDPTGNVLIIAMRRGATRGERDLYVCFKQPDGSFSEPRWCGPTICTWGDKTSPFIAADGVTLYFATDGLRGYGSLDIWMTRRLDDSWTQWSAPVNLGPVINTPDFDAYFTVPAKGEYAYLASCFSGIKGKGRNADIYRVRLTPAVSPLPVVMVSGRVLNRSTRKPMAARIYYEPLKGAEGGGRLIDSSSGGALAFPRWRIGEAWTNPADGSFSIAIPGGGLYGFHAEAEGYYPISEHLDTRNLTGYTELTRNLLLMPARPGETIRLNNLFFDFGKADLRPESIPELERLRSLLENNPHYKVEIAGHTDDIGSEEFNRDLSRRRADAAAAYLTRRGVSPSRLRVVGYGKS